MSVNFKFDNIGTVGPQRRNLLPERPSKFKLFPLHPFPSLPTLTNSTLSELFSNQLHIWTSNKAARSSSSFWELSLVLTWLSPRHLRSWERVFSSPPFRQMFHMFSFDILVHFSKGTLVQALQGCEVSTQMEMQLLLCHTSWNESPCVSSGS